MALDLSALTPYTDEQSSGLIKQILLNANTLANNLVTVKYGVFGDTYKLNYVKSTVVGTNNLCNTTSAGSTILAQGTINLCPIDFYETLCLQDLKKVWYDLEMSRKYAPEDLGSEAEIFASNKVETTGLEIEKILWRGNKASGSGNLALCDGFLATAAALTGEVIVTIAAMTSSNAVAYIDSIVAVAPESILDKLEIYLSPRDFQLYLMDLNKNYKYNVALMGTEKVQSIFHPGSIGTTVHSVAGLSGAPSGTFIATAKENIVIAFGGDEDINFDMYYSKDKKALVIDNNTKFGTGFYFPELVIRSS